MLKCSSLYIIAGQLLADRVRSGFPKCCRNALRGVKCTSLPPSRSTCWGSALARTPGWCFSRNPDCSRGRRRPRHEALAAPGCPGTAYPITQQGSPSRGCCTHLMSGIVTSRPLVVYRFSVRLYGLYQPGYQLHPLRDRRCSVVTVFHYFFWAPPDRGAGSQSPVLLYFFLLQVIQPRTCRRCSRYEPRYRGDTAVTRSPVPAHPRRTAT